MYFYTYWFVYLSASGGKRAFGRVSICSCVSIFSVYICMYWCLLVLCFMLRMFISCCMYVFCCMYVIVNLPLLVHMCVFVYICVCICMFLVCMCLNMFIQFKFTCVCARMWFVFIPLRGFVHSCPRIYV